MRFAARPLATLALTVLGACGSITDPTSPSALAARRPRTAKPPILFVHGWNSSASVWTTMIGRFQKDGWQKGELASFSYNSSLSNATTAATIAEKVAALQQANGGAKVTIIGHSMGTLSSRYYVRNLGGTATVANVISLAGANHGTNTAIFCFQTSCREMIPGSAFLTALNADDETWGSPRYGAWWSPCDQVINPIESAQILTADNTQTACLQHSQLYEDATVYAQVRDYVNQPAAAAVVASAR